MDAYRAGFMRAEDILFGIDTVIVSSSGFAVFPDSRFTGSLQNSRQT